MRTYKEIKKIIGIKGSFSVRFDYRIMHGWGNCGGITPCIYVYQFLEGYKIFLFNLDEYNHAYFPHGRYVYVVRKNGIEYYENYFATPEPCPYKFDTFPTSPWGWGEEEHKYLNELLKVLQDGLN